MVLKTSTRQITLIDGASIAASGNANGTAISVPCVDCPQTYTWAEVSGTFTASTSSTLLTFHAANDPDILLITAVSVVPTGS